MKRFMSMILVFFVLVLVHVHAPESLSAEDQGAEQKTCKIHVCGNFDDNVVVGILDSNNDLVAGVAVLGGQCSPALVSQLGKGIWREEIAWFAAGNYTFAIKFLSGKTMREELNITKKVINECIQTNNSLFIEIVE